MKILAFAGSIRRDSFNQKLLRISLEGARAAGAEVTLVQLADYELPLMNQNLEAQEGLPPNARKLKDIFLAHQGLLLACPEYNGSITPLLKNTLDWVSRPADGQNGLVPYQNKVALLLSASPGALGGLRGLVHLRQTLQALTVLVLSEQLAVNRAHEQFDAAGRLTDLKTQASLDGLTRRLVSVAGKLGA